MTEQSRELEKIRAWCALQERSQHECRQKLYSYGLHRAEVEEIIATLISENFLNEERFAKAFAGGKFRMKGWGRVKIRKELRNHRLSDYCIERGIETIKESEYLQKISQLAGKKAFTLKKKDAAAGLYRYLISKGYETSLVMEEIKKLNLASNESGIEE